MHLYSLVEEPEDLSLPAPWPRTSIASKEFVVTDAAFAGLDIDALFELGENRIFVIADQQIIAELI